MVVHVHASGRSIDRSIDHPSIGKPTDVLGSEAFWILDPLLVTVQAGVSRQQTWDRHMYRAIGQYVAELVFFLPYIREKNLVPSFPFPPRHGTLR